MKWIVKTSIFRRLFMASLLVAIIPGLIIYLLGTTYIQSLYLRGSAVQVSTDSVKAATTQFANLQHMNADLISLQAGAFVTTNILGGQKNGMSNMQQDLNQEILSLQKTLNKAIPDYQHNYQLQTAPRMASVRTLFADNPALQSLTNDQEGTLARVVGMEWQPYVLAQGKVLQALNTNRPVAEVQQDVAGANKLYQPLERDWQHVVDLAEKTGDTVAGGSTAQTTLAQIYAIIAIFSIIVVVVGVGFFVNLTIVRPLRQLTMLTRRISNGDTRARARIAGQDEIYMVARSMNAMLDRMVQLIQITQGQRDELQARVETLVGEVSGVGEGNLRVQATVTNDALGMLSESFNFMVQELSNLVLHVQMAAREVENSTVMVFDRLANLVQTSDTQLQQIAAATNEVQQMAQFSRQVAQRLRLLDTVADEANLTVQTGRQAAQRATEGMLAIHDTVQTTASKVQMLDDHSRAINEIIMVISNIASQTNGLAYDAAEQAVKALENGKGFGAVASDIQRLAERTKNETASVATILRSVSDDIQQVAASMQATKDESARGMKLTEDAGASLEAIFGAIEHQARESKNINQMAMEQLQSFEAILYAMERISQTTRQLHGMTGETSQQVEYLAWQVDQLRASVRAFKLHNAQGQRFPSYSDLPTMQKIQALKPAQQSYRHP